MKLYETTDYEIFDLHEFNRDVKKLKALEQSMKAHGYIAAYPMHVQKSEGGKLKIKGGNHRFTIASKLGIPVFYVVCDDDAAIHELEKATSTWSLVDYLVSWCRVGKEDYIEVRNYCTRTGIPLSLAASMFFGNQAGSGNFNEPFKAGTFKIKDRKHARAIEEIVAHMKNCGVECHNAHLLVQSISRIIYVPEFDAETFKLKVKSHAHMITKQANAKEYMSMIEAVYNRQNKEKIPLAFLADTAAKSRIAGAKFKKKEAEPTYLPSRIKARRAVNE